jgi:hypothetical protein
LSDALISLIPTYGPWTIFGIVALESAGVSLPGETILVAAARPRLRPRAHSGVPHGTSPPPWTVSWCNHDRTRRFREEAAGFSIAPRRPVRGEVTHDIGGSEALDSTTSGEGHHRCNSNIHYQRMSVSVVARPGFEPTAFLVRMIASPAARNFPYDMATETTIAVLRA